MQELEKLLNSMIKKWWKPWGKEYTAIDVIQDGREECLMFWDAPKRQMKAYTFRSLVSIESGFWQFVCKKDIHNKGSNWIKDLKTQEGVLHAENRFAYYDYEYRLIESALIPEKELAKFLVDNIDIKN